MNSRLLRAASLGLGLGLILSSLAGCGSGGGGSSGGMSIVSCSLGCVDSATQPGRLVSCGNTDVFVNQAIRITFSNPIKPLSVDNVTFKMVDGSGLTPPGTFDLDPNDARVLIYRPLLTFDSAGNPTFGLTEDESYELEIPGSLLDSPGPYIENTIGQPNESRLDCTLTASRGVFDASPGLPRITATVDVVTGYDANNNPISFALDQPANGATNVFRDTEVRMVFNDIMNPATLVNRVTGLSEFITVTIDPDGNTVDDDDQVPVAGFFTIAVDQNALRTAVEFHPSGSLPSAGNDPNDPDASRKIVIKLSPQISDLGGNHLANGADIIFTAEKLVFEARDITEVFDTTSNQDSVRTGSTWGAGRLAKGPGGGSGRLGDLIVLPNRVVELDTDLEDFSGIDSLEMFNPDNVIDRPATLEVVDGVFEFSRLRIDAGGVLRFKGSKPARLYVRGDAVIQGLLDLSGQSSPLHQSSELEGGLGGSSGPAGGTGGPGGMRPDGTNFQADLAGGVPNPAAGPENVLDSATYDRVNGQNGSGIPVPSSIHPSPSFVGFGGGGIAWPQPSAANPALHMPAMPTDFGGLQFEKLQECRTITPAAPGGGGAHALSGGDGIPLFGGILTTPVTEAPPAEGGDSSGLNIDATVRTLSPELGLLRGGAGGGGGGAHLQQTQINGIQLFDCFSPVPAGGVSKIISYVAHSSAGGGGGGGAVQIAAGRRIILNGVINASGGDGGSGTFPPPPTNPEDFAQAGGGGAGGGVLLQAQQLILQAVPARINIAGGDGGSGTGLPFPVTPSEGGNGSPGFLRLEANVAPSLATEAPKVAPRATDLLALYGGSATIADLISTAVWNPVSTAPSGMSGAQSCWLRPTDNFFQLVFEPDGSEPGWDLRLRITGQANPQSYRGANDLFAGQTLEEVFGSDLGSAPLVVRFQAARALGALSDPCAVVETGIDSPLQNDSLTDWVRHPAELSDFHGDPGLTPNIFRFVILWDESQPFFDQIEGIEDVRVRVTPD